MTSNDAEIDVLMRRFAGHARGNAAPEHLDADELNAFAEGSLPPAARARYVSHLADCDNCRKLASQLAMSAGAVANSEPAKSIEAEQASWSQRLAVFFAPRNLRYAAFAMVLIAAAGVVFLVTRRPNETALVARNDQANQTSIIAEKQNASVAQPSVSTETQTATTRGAAPDALNKDVDRERDESKVAATSAPPPKPPAESTSSTLAAEKSAEPATAKAPSYAPPPPGESQQVASQSRAQQNVGGVFGGPRKTESQVDNYKLKDQTEATAARDRQNTDDSNRIALNQPAPSARRVSEDKRSGPSRNMDNTAGTGRSTNELRLEAPKKQSAEVEKSKEEESETRSVGGRKFQRRGSAWVDQKFKSSMSVRNVSRGSEEFGALDSGLRSIAQQLGGEILVVWKGKAYRIR